jgi:hypothetical protein
VSEILSREAGARRRFERIAMPPSGSPCRHRAPMREQSGRIRFREGLKPGSREDIEESHAAKSGAHEKAAPLGLRYADTLA